MCVQRVLYEPLPIIDDRRRRHGHGRAREREQPPQEGVASSHPESKYDEVGIVCVVRALARRVGENLFTMARGGGDVTATIHKAHIDFFGIAVAKLPGLP